MEQWCQKKVAFLSCFILMAYIKKKFYISEYKTRECFKR